MNVLLACIHQRTSLLSAILQRDFRKRIAVVSECIASVFFNKILTKIVVIDEVNALGDFLVTKDDRSTMERHNKTNLLIDNDQATICDFTSIWLCRYIYPVSCAKLTPYLANKIAMPWSRIWTEIQSINLVWCDRTQKFGRWVKKAFSTMHIKTFSKLSTVFNFF